MASVWLSGNQVGLSSIAGCSVNRVYSVPSARMV